MAKPNYSFEKRQKEIAKKKKKEEKRLNRMAKGAEEKQAPLADDEDKTISIGLFGKVFITDEFEESLNKGVSNI